MLKVLCFCMVILKACATCGSNRIVCNGFTAKGKQKYYCKACGCYRTLGTTQFYSKDDKKRILDSYKERSSLRGLTRIYGVSRTTVISWLKKSSTV